MLWGLAHPAEVLGTGVRSGGRRHVRGLVVVAVAACAWRRGGVEVDEGAEIYGDWVEKGEYGGIWGGRGWMETV